MGRARGRTAAAAADPFASVMGTRRGGPGMALLEPSGDASPQARAAMAPYVKALRNGKFSATLALLAEYEEDIERSPRLQELQAELCDEMHQNVARRLDGRRGDFFTSMGLERYPTEKALVRASKSIEKVVAKNIGNEDHAAVQGMAEHAWREAAVEHFVEQADADPEKVVVGCLGEGRYLRLRAEAAGLADEQDLQELAKEPQVPEILEVNQASLPALGHTMERVNWREFARGAAHDWIADELAWDKNGRQYGPVGRTPGIRGTSRYKLARLLRKKSRPTR